MKTKINMLSYIKKEQDHLSKIIDIFPNQFMNINSIIKGTNNWLVLATGSSYNAILSSKYYIEHIAPINIQVESSYNFLQYEKLRPETDLVIGISQSGESTSTLAAMEKCKKQKSNLKIIGVTSQPTSKISKYSDLILDLNIGKEKVGYVTLGFNATVLSLMLMGLVRSTLSTEKKETELLDFKNIVMHINSAIELSTQFFNDFKYLFMHSSQFTTIAYGANVGTAKEMETKFTEVVRYPAFGYELENFMHGPYLGVKSNQTQFFIETNAKDKVLTKEKKLKLFENRCTPYIFTINLSKEVKDTDGQTLNLLNIKDQFKTPLLAIIPIQVLAWYISKIKGVNLSHLIFDDFSDVVHNKAEHQDYI